MNAYYLMAAGLSLLVSIVHLFAGTPEIMQPVLTSNVPSDVKSTQLVVWHAVSLFLVLTTIALVWMAKNKNAALWSFVMAMQLGFVGLFVVLNVSMHGALLVMPQWTVFLAIAGLMAIGHRQTI